MPLPDTWPSSNVTESNVTAFPLKIQVTFINIKLGISSIKKSHILTYTLSGKWWNHSQPQKQRQKTGSTFPPIFFCSSFQAYRSRCNLDPMPSIWRCLDPGTRDSGRVVSSPPDFAWNSFCKIPCEWRILKMRTFYKQRFLLFKEMSLTWEWNFAIQCHAADSVDWFKPATYSRHCRRKIGVLALAV